MNGLEDALIRAPAFLLGIGLHEWSHAFVADRAGDPTPRSQGRLTLNPLNHLDPVGTLCILVAPIGWGRPVQVSPWKMRHPDRDHMRVAAAGPLMNLVLAAGSLLLLEVLGEALGGFGRSGPAYLAARVLLEMITLNLVLAIFNLLPVPPLDGERVASYHLGEAGKQAMAALRPYGMWVVLGLVMSGVLGPLFSFGFGATAALRAAGGVPALAAATLVLGVAWCSNAGLFEGAGPRRGS